MSAQRASSAAPRTTLWAVRALVMGSLVVSASHVYPAWEQSSMEKAIHLVGEDGDDRYVREGIRRIRRQGIHSKERRNELVKAGAIRALIKGMSSDNERTRDAAMGALAMFGAPGLLRERVVANVLVDETCGESEGCRALWDAIVGTRWEEESKEINRTSRINVLKQVVNEEK